MTKKLTYTIQSEPDWLYEAAACIGEKYRNNDDTLIENHDRFGMSQEEMTNYLAVYRAYKQTVMPEMEVLLAKYPNLSNIVIATQDSNSIVSSMYYYLRQLIEQENHNHDGIDWNAMNEALYVFYVDLIMDNIKEEIDETTIQIHNVSDVIQWLSRTTLEDKEKLDLIMLYSERSQRIPEILQFLKEGGAICAKHKHLIAAHHQASVKALQQQDRLDLIRLKMDSDLPTVVYVCIFGFNQISVQQKHHEQVIFMGMYVSYLAKRKETNRYQSEDVITALKALADSTRWKILSLLATKPMYLQEIANAMELSPATISHHVNLLVTSAFVNILFDASKSKKIYYETNNKGLNDMASIISSFAQRRYEDQ